MPELNPGLGVAANSLVIWKGAAFINLQHFINGLQIGQIRIRYGETGSLPGFNIPPDFKKLDLILPPPKFGGFDSSKITTDLLTWCRSDGTTGTGHVLYLPPKN